MVSAAPTAYKMFSFGLFYWLSHFLGFLYPTYASYKALMTPGTSDDTHVRPDHHTLP